MRKSTKRELFLISFIGFIVCVFLWWKIDTFKIASPPNQPSNTANDMVKNK